MQCKHLIDCQPAILASTGRGPCVCVALAHAVGATLGSRSELIFSAFACGGLSPLSVRSAMLAAIVRGFKEETRTEEIVLQLLPFRIQRLVGCGCGEQLVRAWCPARDHPRRGHADAGSVEHLYKLCVATRGASLPRSAGAQRTMPPWRATHPGFPAVARRPRATVSSCKGCNLRAECTKGSLVERALARGATQPGAHRHRQPLRCGCARRIHGSGASRAMTS
jgi:hypothetical protein